MSTYFQDNKSFGVVTVMDVRIFNFPTKSELKGVKTPGEFLALFNYDGEQTGKKEPIAMIEHLQIATLSTDGPNITIQGGKYNNALIKYGKTARCEMTDALALPKALEALGGAVINDGNISITDKFGAPVTLIGDTFVVDQESGRHIPVKVLMYKFLPDSTPTFAFDSGNAATFDLNGDLLAVDLNTTPEGECPSASGYFFSLIPSPTCTIPDAGSGSNSDSSSDKEEQNS